MNDKLLINFCTLKYLNELITLLFQKESLKCIYNVYCIHYIYYVICIFNKVFLSKSINVCMLHFKYAF